MWGTQGTRPALIIASCLLAATTAFGVQTTIGGRQVDLDVTLSLRQVIPENGSTTRELALQQLRVRAAVRLTDWLRFDSTTLGSHGGPTLESNRSGIYTWDDVFQDVSPAVDFEEAYFDVLLPSVDIRVGKQKIAWGKLDRVQPTDLINPLSYLDPFLQDEAEQKIGVPALQVSYYLPAVSALPEESRLTAVWVPRYLPFRFPEAGCRIEAGQSRCNIERWYPPAGVPPTTFSLPAGVIPLPNGGTNPELTVPLAFQTTNDSLPGWRLENSGIGLRYAGLARDVDFALYYYHGFDVQPAFRLTAEAIGPPPDFSDPARLDLTGVTTLSPEFRHIDAWGVDFAYPFDRFTIRGEGVFVRGRPFSRDLRRLITDPELLADEIAEALAALAAGAGRAPVELPPSFVVRDAIEWGLGADVVYDGYVLLFQVNQTDVLRNSVDLLIKDVETRLLANLRKSFLSDAVQTQLVAVHAIESDYTFLRPRIQYRLSDHLAVEVGYVFIAGRAQSVVGQYRRNDQGFVRLEGRL